MKLRTYLESLNLKDLKNVYKNCQLDHHKIYERKKLVNNLCEYLMTNKQLIARLASCDLDQIKAIYEAIGHNSSIVCLLNTKYAENIQNLLLGEIDSDKKEIQLFDEWVEMLHQSMNADFKETIEHMNWFIQCYGYVLCYYGIAPLELVYKLFTFKEKDSFENMMNLYSDFESVISLSHILSCKQLGIEINDIHHPLYTDSGYIVLNQLFDNSNISYIKQYIDNQGNLDFYIPTIEEIEYFFENNDEINQRSYRKIHDFFIKQLNLTQKKSKLLCQEIWRLFYNSEIEENAFNMIIQNGLIFGSETKEQHFMQLLSTARSHTRMLSIRGHKPSEIGLDTNVFDDEFYFDYLNE